MLKLLMRMTSTAVELAPDSIRCRGWSWLTLNLVDLDLDLDLDLAFRQAVQLNSTQLNASLAEPWLLAD